MSERHLDVAVITPEGAVFEGRAKQVIVPAFDGEVAFLPMHAPFVAALGAGEMHIQPADGGEEQHFYLEGGVVRVADDKVAVLAEAVRALDSLDVEEERRALAAVLKTPAVESLEALDSRQLAADAARARIRAAKKIQER